ncbi:MAG: MBL fold metallo-hydrolase [Blautia sp.]|nr:MBL fold metallo-hydrolase [Blautia sp.]
MQIIELKYSSTNTYIIEGTNGLLLFDTGWAGTFRAFCREMGEKGIPVQKISYILISHFHPDHCGIAQEIADCGAVIAVPDVQHDFIHSADRIFEREPEKRFCPIDDRNIRLIDLKDSRSFLAEIGIDGEIIDTPGHSDDSISLLLDDGSLFVGDLNPLYELEMHQGTQIGQSWEKLLARKPTAVYYGHAKTTHLEERQSRSDAVNVAGRQSNSGAAYMTEMQDESDKVQMAGGENKK